MDPEGARPRALSDPAPAGFDEFSEEYRAIVDRALWFSGEGLDYYARYKATWLEGVLGPGFSGAILDYGCGVGVLITALREKFPRARIDGYDPSSKSVERIPGPGTFSTDLAVFGSNYDCAILANVLHHVPPAERDGVIASVASRLKKGGRLVIFEHNIYNPATRYSVHISPIDHDAILLSRREASGLLRSSDLEIIRSDYIVFFPKFASLFRFLEPFLRWCPLGAQFALVARKL